MHTSMHVFIRAIKNIFFTLFNLKKNFGLKNQTFSKLMLKKTTLVTEKAFMVLSLLFRRANHEINIF